MNAWSNYSSKQTMDEIRITHDLGVASIDIRKPVRYFGRWVDKYLFGIVLFLCAAFWIFIFLPDFIDWYRKQKVEAKSKNEDGENARQKDLIIENESKN